MPKNDVSRVGLKFLDSNRPRISYIPAERIARWLGFKSIREVSPLCDCENDGDSFNGT